MNKVPIVLSLSLVMILTGCMGHAQTAKPEPPAVTPVTGNNQDPKTASHTDPNAAANANAASTNPSAVNADAAGSNTTAVNAALKSKLIHYSGPSDKKKQAALTFDDGPDDRYTLQILDILKKYNVKATFFLIGQKAKAHPDVVKRIVQEGHAIGNHTWSHPDLDKIGTVKVMEEISKTQDELASIIGYRPTLFRPPYGAVNPADLQAISDMGLSIVNWSVDTRDWAGTPTQGILSAVHKELKPGDHTGALCRREEP